MRRFTSAKLWLFIGIFLSVWLLIQPRNLIPVVSAECYNFCACCDEIGQCKGTCVGAADPDAQSSESDCESFCRSSPGPYNQGYCWSVKCDACQTDSDCGSGCQCVVFPDKPNYCSCDGGGGGGGGGGNRECWGDCRGFIKHKACNLRLDSVGDTTASFSWQPADPLRTRVVISVCRWWNVRYADPSQCEVYKQDVTGLSSFTATNLWPDTDYWAQIATVGGADICQDVYYWDGKVAFHTLSNQPPTCDLSALPSSLTYDGRAYYDRNRNGARIQQDPTTHDYTIATSDPDGDTVTIASVTVSQPACLQASHDGSTVPGGWKLAAGSWRAHGRAPLPATGYRLTAGPTAVRPCRLPADGRPHRRAPPATGYRLTAIYRQEDRPAADLPSAAGMGGALPDILRVPGPPDFVRKTSF